METREPKFSLRPRRSLDWLVRVLFLAASINATPAFAQTQGPMRPPPPQDEPAGASPQTTVPAQIAQPPKAATEQKSSGITHEQPALPVDQIIQKFAAAETDFKVERDNFTYTQDFSIQTIDEGGRVDGEYRMTSEITFTPQGKRYDEVTYAPPPTLERITLSQQDLDDLRNVQPFVLTTAELPKYNVTYVGREKIDDVGTYVFDVGPKQIEKNQRYFQGRVWVDDKDLQIVKTDGKAVPDIRKGNNENVFPRFETYRENIEGHYWFPTYTRSDDTLHFKTENVHIRMTVHYTDYKRFRVTMRIIPPAGSAPAPQPPAPAPTPAPNKP